MKTLKGESVNDFREVSVKRNSGERLSLNLVFTVGTHGITAIRSGRAFYSLGIEIWRGEDLSVIPWRAVTEARFSAKEVIREEK